MKKLKPLTDESGEVRELLIEDMKRFRPVSEVVAPALAKKLAVRGRGPQEGPGTERVTIPLSRDVLDRFRATGAGWESRVDAALRQWLNINSPA